MRDSGHTAPSKHRLPSGFPATEYPLLICVSATDPTSQSEHQREDVDGPGYLSSGTHRFFVIEPLVHKSGNRTADDHPPEACCCILASLISSPRVLDNLVANRKTAPRISRVRDPRVNGTCQASDGQGRV